MISFNLNYLPVKVDNHVGLTGSHVVALFIFLIGMVLKHFPDHYDSGGQWRR